MNEFSTCFKIFDKKLNLIMTEFISMEKILKIIQLKDNNILLEYIILLNQKALNLKIGFIQIHFLFGLLFFHFRKFIFYLLIYLNHL